MKTSKKPYFLINIIFKSTADFITTPKLWFISIFPFILGLGLLILCFVFLLDPAIDWVNGLLGIKENTYLNIAIGTVITILIIVFSWLFSISLIGVFFVDKIIEIVRKKHYSDVKIKTFGNVFTLSGILIKEILKLILYFIIALIISLMFPAALLFLTIIPPVIFLKNTLLYDVGSQTVTREKYNEILADNKWQINLLMICLYLFTLIPIVNYFAVVIQFEAVSHFFLEKAKL